MKVEFQNDKGELLETVDIDLEKFFRLKEENPESDVTFEFGAKPPEPLQPNKQYIEGDGKFYHFLISEVLP